MKSIFGKGILVIIGLLMGQGGILAKDKSKGLVEKDVSLVEIKATIRALSSVDPGYFVMPYGPDRPLPPDGTLTISGSGISFTVGAGANEWQGSGMSWTATLREKDPRVSRFGEYNLTYRLKGEYHHFPIDASFVLSRYYQTAPQLPAEVSGGEGSQVYWALYPEWDLDGYVTYRGILAFPSVKLKEVAWKNSEPIRQESAAKFGQPFPEPQWSAKEKDKVESSAICYAGEKKVMVSPKWEATGLGIEEFKGNKLYLHIEGPGGLIYKDTEIAFPASGKLSLSDLELLRGETDTGFEKRIKYYGTEKNPPDGKWKFTLKSKSVPTEEGTELAVHRADIKTYVILSEQPATFMLYHTPLHLGCKNADGEDGQSAASVQRVVDLVWNDFADLLIYRADGTGPMRYWGPQAVANEYWEVNQLLRYMDGRCAAWAKFFIYTFRSLQLPDGPEFIFIEHEESTSLGQTPEGFGVHPGAKGQGNVLPGMRVFTDGHAVCYFNKKIYDPSYGIVQSGIGRLDCVNKWENLYVKEYRFVNILGDEIKPYTPNNASANEAVGYTEYYYTDIK